jgi:glutaredoxin 3
LCKRPSVAPPVIPSAPIERIEEAQSSIVTTLLGAGALIGIAAAVAFGLSIVDDFEVALARSPQVEVGAVPPDEQREASRRGPEQAQSDSAAQARADRTAANEPAPSEPPAEPAGLATDDFAQQQVERAEQARRQRVQAEETAAQDRRRKQMIESEWRERSERQARQGIVVVMYSTSWCPSCVAARSYMDSKGIAYVDHDIDQSESARMTMRRLNPRGSVPTIDIDGTVLVGFGAGSLEGALDRAARKRAGI